MCHFENIWLENSPPNLKPTVYRWFLDDAFLLFRSKDHVEKFKNDLNKQHKNKIYVTNITIQQSEKFVTYFYRKPTFNGVFTIFESFIPDMYKRGLIETLLHRKFRLCSNCENFRRETETFKLNI